MSVLRFGVFELDPAVPELRCRGRPVHLQEMPLRLLEMLLERPGELVPREAFFARLWPEDDSGMLDDNLNTAVRKLRLALNDSAHRPRYIETVPRRGYRFVTPVTRDEDLAPSAGKPAPRAPAPRQPSRLRAASIVLVPVALAAILAAAVLPDLIGKPGAPSEAPAAREFKTLAVLPFVNASGDPADEYFAVGLTEELMDRLSRPQGFRLVSRTSAFSLKDTDMDAREIGRMLGADTLVEGSVRRDGDRLRISTHLVDAHNGYQLWSESYDRRMVDVFEVQEDIALSITNRLTGRLLGPAEAEDLKAPVTDPVAYDLYLQGRFHWHRRSARGLRAAAQYFEDAVERAPDYAPAWIGLGDAYAVLGFYDYIAPAEAFPKAQETARRALQLDRENAAAEATLGYATLYYDWDFVEAEDHFLRALELRPGFSKAHQWYANLLTAAGRFDEAEQEMRRAQQTDPLSLIANAALGWVRYHAGRHRDALDQYRLTLDLDPDFELAYLWSGWSLELLGEHDQALAMLEEAVERSGGSGISMASLARLHAVRGERDKAEELLARLLESPEYVPSYEIAKAYQALGERDEALAWLERAFEQRSHSLVFLEVDPQLEALRNDAAFVRLADRVMASGRVSQQHAGAR